MAGGVEIGNNVILSYGVVILSTGLNTDLVKKGLPPEHIFKRVVIKDNVWIGANAMIMPGVCISSNSVVAAGAVVTKDLEKEGWLYAGVPAVPIKPL